MLTKILIFLGVVIGVFVVARMGAASANGPGTILRGRRRDRAKTTKSAKADDMAPCPTCGAYVTRGETCPCGNTPTP